MWKYLLRQGGRLVKWSWKGLKSGGAFILRPFSGLVSGRTGGVLRSLWRIVDVGLTGYFIYDIFWGDDEGAADAAHTMIFESLVPESVAMALSVPINDTSVVCNAFALQGVKYINDEASQRTIRGLGYLGAAAYLNEYPYGTLKYGPEQIKEILKGETTGFFKEFNSDISQEDLDQLESAIDDIDWDGMEMDVIRRFDFICYIISDLADYAELSESQTNINQVGSNLAPGGNFATNPIQM